MIFLPDSEPSPITIDAEGVMRIRKTRVTLDTVVDAFEEGATAEEIAQQYPSLGLADTYSVISYYLHNRAKLREYLEKRTARAEEIRAENLARFNPVGIRTRLASRKVNRSV